jgi:hypothetical protein
VGRRTPNLGKVTKPPIFSTGLPSFVVARLIREAHGVLNPNGSVWADFVIDHFPPPINNYSSLGLTIITKGTSASEIARKGKLSSKFEPYNAASRPITGPFL